MQQVLFNNFHSLIFGKPASGFKRFLPPSFRAGSILTVPPPGGWIAANINARNLPVARLIELMNQRASGASNFQDASLRIGFELPDQVEHDLSPAPKPRVFLFQPVIVLFKVRSLALA